MIAHTLCNVRYTGTHDVANHKNFRMCTQLVWTATLIERGRKADASVAESSDSMLHRNSHPRSLLQSQEDSYMVKVNMPFQVHTPVRSTWLLQRLQA